MSSYREDLAFINDDGFSDFTSGSIPGILALLKREGIPGGLIVDLGCGAGRLAEALNNAGYEVLGVDLSPAMIQLARLRAPGARFLVGSLLSTAIPASDAITAIGECINYQFDPAHSRAALRRFFRRVYHALRPGGLFIFDVAEPSRIPTDAPCNYWKEGPGWSIHVEVDGDFDRRSMTRKIVCFRQIGNGYRRSEELHRLALLDSAEVAAELQSIGFRVRTQAGYGRFRLYPGMRAIMARKPR